MKRACETILTLLFFLLSSIGIAFGQDDDRVYTDSAITAYKEYLIREAYQGRININRDPINICFLIDNDRYVGFIVAGHASHEVCQVASLHIKNFLDSVGYTENTVFSFGVGFDDRRNDWTPTYNQLLSQLEADFSVQEERYPSEIRVQRIPYHEYKKITTNIQDRIKLVVAGMKNNDSINRIIFKYEDVDFPVPVPFYDKDSIVSFTIPVADIGKIPNFKEFEATLIKQAINALKAAIEINDKALQKLDVYKANSSLVKFEMVPYIITISNGLEKETHDDFLFQFNSDRIVKVINDDTKELRHYYSLSEMRTKCANGETVIDLNKMYGRSEKIYPCKEVDEWEAFLLRMDNTKNNLLSKIKGLNAQLQVRKKELEKIYSKIENVKVADNSAIYVDAFLRGWPFQTGDTLLNMEMDKWFDKRATVWKNILRQNKLFGDTLTFKKSPIPRKDEALRVTTRMKMPSKKMSEDAPSPRIAGIFHADDVFFVVKRQSDRFIVIPYKMLSGNFIQIIDRISSVCQFVSQNNFRQVKL